MSDQDMRERPQDKGARIAPDAPPDSEYRVYFWSRIAACAAASRAIGTRKGEQDT